MREPEDLLEEVYEALSEISFQLQRMLMKKDEITDGALAWLVKQADEARGIIYQNSYCEEGPEPH